jgi:hypothetical protein
MYLVIDAGGVSNKHDIVMIEGLKEERGGENQSDDDAIENLDKKTLKIIFF